MQLVFSILWAVVENIVLDALIFIPNKVYVSLLALIFGQTGRENPRRIHWAYRYSLGLFSVLLFLGLIGLGVKMVTWLIQTAH